MADCDALIMIHATWVGKASARLVVFPTEPSSVHHGAVKAPPNAPTPPPIKAPVSGFPPTRADRPAPAPAPSAPPVTARVRGLYPQALNVSNESSNITVFMTYTSEE
jgi:hypothetical protein